MLPKQPQPLFFALYCWTLLTPQSILVECNLELMCFINHILSKDIYLYTMLRKICPLFQFFEEDLVNIMFFFFFFKCLKSAYKALGNDVVKLPAVSLWRLFFPPYYWINFRIYFAKIQWWNTIVFILKETQALDIFCICRCHIFQQKLHSLCSPYSILKYTCP